MDSTAQFVLIAKRILRELRALSESIVAGFLGVQKQVETVAKEQKAQNEREKAPPILRAELQISEAIEHKKEADGKKKVRREWYALVLNLLTLAAVVAYAIINYHMFCQMKIATEKAGISADAAKSAADTASDNLIAENRPWVTAAVSLEEPPNSHSPKPGLTFNSDGSASFNCFIVIKNIGKSIATGIYIRAKMYPPPLPLFITDPVNKEKALCNEVRAEKRNTNMLPSLFPGEESSEPEAIPMTKESIESALRSLPPNLAAMNSVLPVVYGCVNYDFPFSKGIHQTQFIFTMDLVPVNKETTQSSNLKIVKFPFGGSWGD